MSDFEKARDAKFTNTAQHKNACKLGADWARDWCEEKLKTTIELKGPGFDKLEDENKKLRKALTNFVKHQAAGDKINWDEWENDIYLAEEALKENK